MLTVYCKPKGSIRIPAHLEKSVFEHTFRKPRWVVIDITESDIDGSGSS